jgi:6-phosphogluconolactonase
MSSSSSSESVPHVFENATALSVDLHTRLAALSAEAIAARGSFHVALSGGSLPSILSNALLSPADANGVRKPLLNMDAWHWWFADERCVRLNDPDSNYAEANKHIFRHLPPISAERMHSIDDNLVSDPERAAVAYESALTSTIPSGQIDCVLLGMGPDGHCCSLFPGHPLLQDKSNRLVAPITDSPKPPPQRITLTLYALAKAHHSIFVCTGAGKSDALYTVFKQRRANVSASDPDVLPSALVRSAYVTFLVDKDAAAKIITANL